MSDQKQIDIFGVMKYFCYEILIFFFSAPPKPKQNQNNFLNKT